VEVAVRLDGNAGEALCRELRYQRPERCSIVAQRVGRRQEQLIGLDPGEDVGDLHHVDVPHPALEPGVPCEDTGVLQRR
jgi:hypothetical protein